MFGVSNAQEGDLPGSICAVRAFGRVMNWWQLVASRRVREYGDDVVWVGYIELSQWLGYGFPEVAIRSICRKVVEFGDDLHEWQHAVNGYVVVR